MALLSVLVHCLLLLLLLLLLWKNTQGQHFKEGKFMGCHGLKVQHATVRRTWRRMLSTVVGKAW